MLVAYTGITGPTEEVYSTLDASERKKYCGQWYVSPEAI